MWESSYKMQNSLETFMIASLDLFLKAIDYI